MSRGVLVTGADAPIGERLVRTLLDDDNVGHVLAVGTRPMEEALPFANARRLTYLPVNLTRERRVRELLFGPARDLGIDVIVHTAMGRGAGEEGKAVHEANVNATRDLLALCERHPTIRTFVLRSYAEVYQVQADREHVAHGRIRQERAHQQLSDRGVRARDEHPFDEVAHAKIPSRSRSPSARSACTAAFTRAAASRTAEGSSA